MWIVGCFHFFLIRIHLAAVVVVVIASISHPYFLRCICVSIFSSASSSLLCWDDVSDSHFDPQAYSHMLLQIINNLIGKHCTIIAYVPIALSSLFFAIISLPFAIAAVKCYLTLFLESYSLSSAQFQCIEWKNKKRMTLWNHMSSKCTLTVIFSFAESKATNRFVYLLLFSANQCNWFPSVHTSNHLSANF